MAINEKRAMEIAQVLYASETSRVVIPPVASTWQGLGVPDAYAIQLCNVQRAIDSGRTISGKKIGLTSKAMQELLGVPTPDFGHLFSDMEVRNGEAPMSRLIQPRAEGEIAFILARDLDVKGEITIADVMAATAFVAPAIEIVDSRIANWKIGYVDTVSDNASSGMYVLGKARLDPNSFDLVAETMRLSVNGEVRNAGSGSAVLGNPAFCVAWLANTMRQYGTMLRKGEVILSGALSAMVPVKAGDKVRADFSVLGSVEVEFV